jgi:uncharacterized protein (DUF3084 family)
MTEREDELAWRERALDEKEHELNRIEETLAEKERSLKAAADTIQKGLEYLQTQVKQMSGNIEAECSKLHRTK